MVEQSPLILVIDDDAVDIKIMNRHLKKNGFSYLNAESGKEGLELAKNHMPHLILVDNLMPQMNGKEFCQEIKADDTLKIIPVIMLTGLSDTDNIIAGLEAGADDYISKDMDVRLIMQKIKSLLRMSRMQKEIIKLSETKDEFLSIVSHDLKNPIGVIQTSMEILMDGIAGDLSAEVKDFVARTHRQAKLALSLIHDILDLGQVESQVDLQMEQFKVREVIEENLDCFEVARKEKNIQIATCLESDFSIMADRSKIFQVFNNLLGNAVKFTPENGQIKIEVSSIKGKRIGDDSQVLKVSIHDNGPGIAPNLLEKIFDKYERTKKEKGGTGLGLAICKQICKIHKGKVWAESLEGHGATFCFAIPGIVEEKITILVVDDEENIRWFTRKILEDHGYVIHEAENGQEALHFLQKLRPHLILLDLNMPVMDGFTTLKHLHDSEEFKDIPVIIHNVAQYTQHARDIVYKPAKAGELNDKIKKTLNIETNLHQKTILITEDDLDLQDAVKQYLADQDYNLLSAKNGVEALFLCNKYKVDLIVTDIELPIMDGFSLAGQIQARNPGLPIIMLTGYDHLQKAGKFFNIHTVLTKPIDFEELKKKIAFYLKDPEEDPS